MKKILVINPGSTSTKIAFYHDGEQVWKESIEHDAAEIKKYAVIYDQKDMRTKLVRDALAAHGEKVTELDGVVARGGLLPSYVNEETGAVTTISSGAYEVTPALSKPSGSGLSITTPPTWAALSPMISPMKLASRLISMTPSPLMNLWSWFA